MTHIETLPLFGEPDRPDVRPAPLVVAVQWSNFHPTSRVQCAHCVQLVHAGRGAGPVDVRTARRRRTGPDGELLLCADHGAAKHTADVNAGLVPGPKRHSGREGGVMGRPRLLDLFCCQGGASAGYVAAGFDVIGVDIDPQPRYPYPFRQGDAMTWPLDGFDAVHASPPCQDHSTLVSRSGEHGTGWMLAATIARLKAWGGPYVVENVAGADMPGSLTLCGTEFGLRSGDRWLKRHRQFVSNVFLLGAGGCHCSRRKIGGVYGNGGNGQMTRGFRFNHKRAAEALGIGWMNVKGQAQSIPPAYTRFIGDQLRAHLAATGGGSTLAVAA